LRLNPTKLQTDSTGFTLESVIHIGYELAIITTINLGGGFFSSLDSVKFTKLSNKFYCFSVREGLRSVLSQGLNPTEPQTDSTGFTLESVIHIGYELAIITTINLGGLFFVPRVRELYQTQ